MVRLVISVEGLTEERFIKGSLQPYLAKNNIFVTPISLDGNVNVDRIGSELSKLIYNFDVATTFYDFYGFKKKQDGETKDSLEARILESVSESQRGKCIPYVQMYEFEGLLFSSPEAIENNISQSGLANWANGVLSQFGGDPETINDSPQTAPSKRLLHKSHYIKTIHGPNIAEEIGLNMLREKCTGFNAWLNRLEAL